MFENVARVDKCTDAEQGFQHVGDARLAVSDKVLMLSVRRAALALPAARVRCRFGAPNGRFTHRYRASVDMPTDFNPGGGGGGSGGAVGQSGSAEGGATQGGNVETAGNASGGTTQVGSGGGTTGSHTSTQTGDDAKCGCDFSAKQRTPWLAFTIVLSLGLTLRRRR